MFPMIWWWVAGAAITAIVTAIATDDSSSSSSSSSNDNERRRRENERAEREAQEKAERDREARDREQAALALKSAKNLAVSFLNEHYRNHEKQSQFLSMIQQQNTPYGVKQKFAEIVEKNPCDEIKMMTDNMEKQKSRISQLDVALADLSKLKGSL